ncbi:MAG: pectate lyase family protein [Gammaproteobacteria bacterium]
MIRLRTSIAFLTMRPLSRFKMGMVLVAAALLSPPAAGGTPGLPPAFPGAEGFGAKAIGGRGGRVLEVINLNDSGPGSLRAALTAGGPRIVVFRVSGIIKLLKPIKIVEPYLTVAGQTAPGSGITLRNDPSNTRTPLRVLTHDVVIRYLRSRPGPSTLPSSTLDAFDIGSGYNIIVDHCSFSWATDEVFSTGHGDNSPPPYDLTVQWSIIAEALKNSTAKGGKHGKGSLIGEGGDRISLHHNLYAHNLERNPRIKTNGIVDIVNNVIYNAGFKGSWGASHSTPAYDAGANRINYVANYFKAGVNSGTADYVISTGGRAEIYVADNVVPHNLVRPKDKHSIVKLRHPAAPVTTTSAQQAYRQVLETAGASLPSRDAVDQRLIADVRNGTGRIIDDPADIGGWPEMRSGTPPEDNDHDGMPDAWETAHKLNPKDAADGPRDADNDGYSNVEEYLNGTDPRRAEMQILQQAGDDYRFANPAQVRLELRL